MVLRGGCCRSDPLLLRPTSLRRHRLELRRRRLADRRLGHGRSAHCGKGRTWFVPRGGREGALAPQLSLPPASGLLDSRHPCVERRILSTRDRGRFSRRGRGLTASGARAPAPGLSSRGQLKPRGSALSARCRSKAEHGQRLLGLGSAFAPQRRDGSPGRATGHDEGVTAARHRRSCVRGGVPTSPLGRPRPLGGGKADGLRKPTRHDRLYAHSHAAAPAIAPALSG